jgi:UDP:flavonoid glycosyltransferase YjiC (YdhE family)
MRILIAAVGSRGDVAPITGLGTALRGAGHDVAVATYGMFEGLITGCGLGFRLIPGDPEQLGASEQGQKWQEGGTRRRGPPVRDRGRRPARGRGADGHPVRMGEPGRGRAGR